MLNSYALELQALKAELQLALARLSDVGTVSPVAIETPSTLPTTASTRTLGTARSPPEWSTASVGITGSSTRFSTNAPPSRASRDPQLLLQELQAAAQRRRALEAELATELRRDRERTPWQSRAIAALRRQRAEIARELDEARQRDLFMTESSGSSMEQDTPVSENTRPLRILYKDSATQMSPAPSTLSRSNSHQAAAADKRFSIEGVVTLERIQGDVDAAAGQSAGVHPDTSETTTASVRRHNTALPQHQEGWGRRPDSLHRHYRQPNDALHDVFSLQLKFAETMLKLEKSVQVRDQLLQRSSALTRKTTRSRRGLVFHQSGPASAARHDRLGQQLSEAENQDDDDDESSGSDSFSSGESVGGNAVRLQRHRPDTNDERLVSARRAKSTPASSQTVDGAGGVQAAPLGVAATEDVERTNDSNSREEASHSRAHDASSTPQSNQEEPRTPSTENSDKLSSSAKQVRFGGQEADAYATPMIAKKLSFESPSEDNDGHISDKFESPLSFLGGSSVTSTELNDVSLVKAFEAFRRELGVLKAASPQLFSATSAPSGISAAINAARALFADDKASDAPRRTVVLKPAVAVRVTRTGAAELSRESHTVVVANAAASVHTGMKDSVKRNMMTELEKKPQRGGGELDRAILQERRRQLCLDIQDESTQLVLTFGSRNTHETERIKQTLIKLRMQLRSIDEQLGR